MFKNDPIVLTTFCIHLNIVFQYKIGPRGGTSKYRQNLVGFWVADSPLGVSIKPHLDNRSMTLKDPHFGCAVVIVNIVKEN